MLLTPSCRESITQWQPVSHCRTVVQAISASLSLRQLHFVELATFSLAIVTWSSRCQTTRDLACLGQAKAWLAVYPAIWLPTMGHAMTVNSAAYRGQVAAEQRRIVHVCICVLYARLPWRQAPSPDKHALLLCCLSAAEVPWPAEGWCHARGAHRVRAGGRDV